MATAPWIQFGQKVKAGQMGKTYTIAASVKPLDEPVRVRLEVERAGRPWDRAVRGQDILLDADKWTELHVTFKVTKTYRQGWSAYIHCDQEGARFRADQFRLYEGRYGASAPGGKNLFANPGFEAGTDPWFFSCRVEQHNLKRTYRRTSFLLARLLANMGVAGSTPLLERFSNPVGGRAGASLVKNGDFSVDADSDGMADDWAFSCSARKATCKREKASEGAEEWSLTLTCPPVEGAKKPSTMLAQHHVPIKKGQWYRIFFKARAEGLAAPSVTMTISNMANWRSLFEYQRFTPGSAWEAFKYELQAKETAETKTRLQIWYSGPGTLCVSDVRVQAIGDPTEGRWREGFYLDVPEEWDDPYRFFRW